MLQAGPEIHRGEQERAKVHFRARPEHFKNSIRGTSTAAEACRSETEAAVAVPRMLFSQ
jgi:hypothetical protein